MLMVPLPATAKHITIPPSSSKMPIGVFQSFYYLLYYRLSKKNFLSMFLLLVGKILKCKIMLSISYSILSGKYTWVWVFHLVFNGDIHTIPTIFVFFFLAVNFFCSFRIQYNPSQTFSFLLFLFLFSHFCRHTDI